MPELSAYFQPHQKAYEKILDVLTLLENMGVKVGNRLKVASELVGQCQSVDEGVHAKAILMRTIFGWSYYGSMRVDQSKYDRNALFQLVIDAGIERGEAKTRLEMFEREQEFDEDLDS
jgi:hypothetical protein